MNGRTVTAMVGIIILALGLTGLLFPDFARVTFLGFNADPARLTAVNGEVRATYGGLFVVMGLFTLLAAVNPSAQRARLRFIGFLLWGAGAGRLLGVYLDGDPGLFGWIGVGVELVLGSLLIIAALIAPKPPVAPQVPLAAAPPAVPSHSGSRAE